MKEVPQTKDDLKKLKTPVKSVGPVKFKDKKNRDLIIIDFKQLFGFNPDRFIIEKIPRENNKFLFHAILNDEELKKHEKQLKKMEKLAKEQIKADKGSSDKRKVQSKGK